jgi:hypothetical protein
MSALCQQRAADSNAKDDRNVSGGSKPPANSRELERLAGQGRTQLLLPLVVLLEREIDELIDVWAGRSRSTYGPAPEPARRARAGARKAVTRLGQVRERASGL